MNERKDADGRVGALGSTREATVNGDSVNVAEWGLPPFFF